MSADRETYRVLGIDPGLRITGYAVIGIQKRGEPEILEAGAIRAGKIKDTPSRIEHIYNELTGIIEEFKPDAMAIEKLYSHYDHPQTAIVMAHARGVIMLAASQAKIRLHEIPATQIKKGLTGNGHASKEQVQLAVRSMFHLKQVPRPPDVADAIAAAICAGRKT